MTEIEQTLSSSSHTMVTADHHRRLLLGAASALGAVGVVATAVPFVESMLPSERTKVAAGPVDIDIGG
ncbi:MAG TPA: ubiquinol-cytochrome c reductase iron-sulfur subunit N-terminal domain-containing protein, partial [Burkholderiaceae bacterium]|nr:ubiquinol-cytochrome c reductase iron-sulfur subunit N-terminal domain-containing protein [Burkholderiaceae bacterium]